MSTCLGNDFKRTKVFFHKLLGWSSGSNVIRLDEYLISDREVWSQSLMFVSRGRISCLCCGDGITELEVEFIEVYGKISCSVRQGLILDIWRCWGGNPC